MLRTASTLSVLRTAIVSAALMLRRAATSVLRGAILRASAASAIRRCVARMVGLPALRVVRRASSPSSCAFIRPLLAFMMVVVTAVLAGVAGALALERGRRPPAGVLSARAALAVLRTARRVVVVVARTIAAVVGFKGGVSVSIVSVDETMAIGPSLGPGREVASAEGPTYIGS